MTALCRSSLATLAGLAACSSMVVPPPQPAVPTTAFLLHEAMHVGLVLPPDGPDDPNGYVEFGFGDWRWYALGHDAWYDVFATVLWPTQGTLGRRVFRARTAAELPAEASWARLERIVVDAAAARELRKGLQASFEARAGEAVDRRDLRFRFVPDEASYWFAHTCADEAAGWLRRLGCIVGDAPLRSGLHVVP